MSNYTPLTVFADKDGLTSGNPLKIISGVDVDAEFNSISSNMATKFDSDNVATELEIEAETKNDVLVTPLRLAQWADDNAGVVGDLRDVASLAAGGDKLFFFDDTDDTTKALTISTGLTTSGTNLTTDDSAIVHDNLSGFVANEHIDHSSVTLTAGYGISGGGDITANRTFTLDGSELSTFTDISIVVESQDGIVVNDNSTVKSLPWNKGGIHVETFTASDEIDDTMYGLFMLLANGASGATMTFNSASNAAHTGAVVLLGARDTGDLTLAATGSSTFTSTFEQGGTTNRTIRAGGTGMAIHVGSDEWMLVGDIT